jgi:Ca-activated chloride channel family protein
MKRFVFLLVSVMLALVSQPAPAVGLVVVDETHWQPDPNHPPVIPPDWPRHPRPPRPTPPPSFIRPHVFAPLQLELCQVEVQISDQIAATTLIQEFRNPNPQRIEGTFLFPVPKGAHLDKFAMEIDGQPVEAELLNADKARKIYQDIVRKAKDPALLEYDGQDVFKVRIFPIEGNATKRITMRYAQLLKSDSGLVSYTLPLNTARYSSTPIKTLSVKVQLESKQPIKTLYSPTHAVEIKHNGGRHATVGYETSNLQPDTDLALYFGTNRDEVGINLMTYRADDGNGYFLLLASPGMEVAEARVVPKDVAFVLDTSGSMSGKKLEQAKKALLFCVENLNKDDRFEIIRFSTEVDPLFGLFTATTRANRDRANDFVQGLQAIGGTAIDDALKKALALSSDSISAPQVMRGSQGEVRKSPERPFVLIFLTDGLPTVGATSEQRILDNVKERSDGNVRIFCFGIGTDVNTHLLDKITEHTRATSQYVLPDEDLELKVSNFYSKIKDPVLANPAIRFDGNPHVSRLHPAELPDLFRGEQLVVVGRYDKPGNIGVVLEGTVNGKQQVFELSTAFPKQAKDHEFIPRLWANRRVGYLLDQIRLHGENKELQEEVTELAREYGIVTPYTAYLILEDEQHRQVPTSAQSMPQLWDDRLAREQIQQMGTRYGKTMSGDLAVNEARANASIRSASSLAASKVGLHEAAESLGIAPTLASTSGGARVQPTGSRPIPPMQLTQQSQFAGGRNFYLNDGRWVDSQVQHFPEAKRVKLQFGSDEYFQFSAAHAEARPWLAQGVNVEFILNNTIYEVHE